MSPNLKPGDERNIQYAKNRKRRICITGGYTYSPCKSTVHSTSACVLSYSHRVTLFPNLSEMFSTIRMYCTVLSTVHVLVIIRIYVTSQIKPPARSIRGFRLELCHLQPGRRTNELQKLLHLLLRATSGVYGILFGKDFEPGRDPVLKWD